ncbi:hypothetical protein [Paenibacillus sp. NPDC093718]|uniref:hypothetical protein n=1 Tax=Paenibacillus sp. NPDC093718 TaxID=3390601 RepID=UPI003D053850
MAKGITSQELDTTTASGLVPHLGLTTNSGNSYSVTSNTPIRTNQKFTIKFNVASSTAPTLKINDDTALPIKNANGNNAKLFAGVYTLFRDGSAFILQGEGGEYGTATAADVLVGKTIGTDNGLVLGAMPNRSAENQHMPGLEKTAWTGDRYFIKPPPGFYDGASWVTAPEPQLVAENIKRGARIGNIDGVMAPSVAGTAQLNHYIIAHFSTLRNQIGQTVENNVITIPAGVRYILAVNAPSFGSRMDNNYASDYMEAWYVLKDNQGNVFTKWFSYRRGAPHNYPEEKHSNYLLDIETDIKPTIPSFNNQGPMTIVERRIYQTVSPQGNDFYLTRWNTVLLYS